MKMKKTKERMRERKMLQSNPDIVKTVEQVHPHSSVEPVAVVFGGPKAGLSFLTMPVRKGRNFWHFLSLQLSICATADAYPKPIIPPRPSRWEKTTA